MFNNNEKILTFLPKIYFPGGIFWGEKGLNCFKAVDEEKKLIVSSSILKEANVERFSALFGEETEYFIQDREPLIEDFEKLKSVCEEKNISFLIAFGGGSVIDITKLAKRELKIKMAAIPTTFSGAEVSQHALLIGAGEKKISSSFELLPEIVIANSDFLKSLPREQIIFQSFDALAHSLESLVSKFATPFSEGFSLLAAEKIYFNLNKLSETSEKEMNGILDDLLSASIFAGLAQSGAATGLIHSFAHYFGVKNGISHSQAIVAFMPDVLSLNLEHTDKYEKLNQLKDLSSSDFIPKLRVLFEKLDIRPKKFSLIESVEDAAAKIRKDICTITNPYLPSAEDIIEILKKRVS